MPELPEVETSRRGIEPHLVGATILHAVVRNGRLRWPVSEEIYRLSDQPVLSVQRRAKYLLLELPEGMGVACLMPLGYPAEEPGAPKRKEVAELLTIK